ncbi:MAG: TRAP transporter permease DctQ [Rhodobacteraceae bacterium]|nr:TRAP transporter permease DctQ [Paracoccaceae bacterium]
MTALGKGLDRATYGLSWLGSLCVILMMLHITAEVTLRYLFAVTLPGTLVFVGNYYMIVVVFVPLALLELRGRHIAVDVIARNFPDGLQRVLAALAKLMTTFVMGLLTIAACQQALKKMAVGETIEQGTASILIWPGHFILVAGCALMTLVAFCRFAEIATGRDLGLGPEEAA